MPSTVFSQFLFQPIKTLITCHLLGLICFLKEKTHTYKIFFKFITNCHLVASISFSARKAIENAAWENISKPMLVHHMILLCSRFFSTPYKVLFNTHSYSYVHPRRRTLISTHRNTGALMYQRTTSHRINSGKLWTFLFFWNGKKTLLNFHDDGLTPGSFSETSPCLWTLP